MLLPKETENSANTVSKDRPNSHEAMMMMILMIRAQAEEVVRLRGGSRKEEQDELMPASGVVVLARNRTYDINWQVVSADLTGERKSHTSSSGIRSKSKRCPSTLCDSQQPLQWEKSIDTIYNLYVLYV